MKVVIIGAGVAGLAIGWRLAQQRVETIVLERAQPGRGATWASAGMLAAPGSRVNKTDGEALLANRGAKLWPGFAAEIEEKSGRKIGYAANGSLVVARTESEEHELERLAKLNAGELLGFDAAREIEPRIASDTRTALWNPQQAKVDNRSLGRALAAAFVRAGGHLQLNEAAVRFEFQGDRMTGVRTPFALHIADAYVIAAGAWSARIEGLPAEAVAPVVPVKGEMLALRAPLDQALPGPSIGGGNIYLVSQREQLLIGATVERVGFDSRLSEKAYKWLLEEAVALLPCLSDWEVVEHWAGLRPGSPDDLPIVGACVPRLFVASGQYRNGILYAPAIAETITGMIMGEEVPKYFSAFDPRRFSTDAAYKTEHLE